MQRQGNTADILFNLTIQKAMDPTDDPIADVDDEAYTSGQKADEKWGSGKRAESGKGSLSVKELLKLANKAEIWSSATMTSFD